MRVNFEWDENMVATYNSLFAQASTPGTAIGALITGRLLSKGRRICLIIPSVIAIFGIGF
jgi:hypothetical protein